MRYHVSSPSADVAGGVLPDVSTAPVALICNACPDTTCIATWTGEFRGLESFAQPCPFLAPSACPARVMSAIAGTVTTACAAAWLARVRTTARVREI